jgi:tetratricopeptide (TPR) repeat protein
MSQFQQAVKQNSGDPHAWYNLGLLEKNSGNSQAASEAFRRVTEIDANDADSWYFLGAAYSQNKQYSDAIDAFQHALKLNPQHASAEFGLSRAYQQSADLTQAREHLTRFQYITQSKLGSAMSLAAANREVCYLLKDGVKVAVRHTHDSFGVHDERSGKLFEVAAVERALARGRMQLRSHEWDSDARSCDLHQGSALQSIGLVGASFGIEQIGERLERPSELGSVLLLMADQDHVPVRFFELRLILDHAPDLQLAKRTSEVPKKDENRGTVSPCCRNPHGPAVGFQKRCVRRLLRNQGIQARGHGVRADFGHCSTSCRWWWFAASGSPDYRRP